MVIEQLLERVKAVLGDPNLSASAKIAFVGLSVHSADGRVEVGSRKLAELCGMSRPTLYSALKMLQDGGFVQVAGDGVDRRDYRLAADVGPKKHRGRKLSAPFESFDLIGIVKCDKCGEWLDVEHCEKLTTTAIDATLTAELVDVVECECA